MANRLYYLDNLKGLLIILVILGHAIQFTLPDYENAFAFRFIYSFHMPLFFFISGYLANRGCFKKGVISKRVLQLLVPFVIWALIGPLLKSGTLDLAGFIDTLLYPDKGLWFLYNLFVYSAIFTGVEWLHEKAKINRWIIVGGGYIVLGALMVVFLTKFNCTQLCYHYIFFTVGYGYKTLSIQPKYRYLLLGGVIFAVLVPFWTTSGSPLFYTYINLGGAFAYLYRYGVQIIGMWFFFETGRRFLNSSMFFISEYGTLTLGIYALQFSVLHHLFNFIGLDSIVLKISIEAITATVICYILVKTIKCVPYLRLLLIGDANINK